MNGHVEHAPLARSAPRSASKRGAPVYPGLAIATGPSSASRTDAERLRDIAAVLRHEADALATILPTGQTDVRADLALLRMVADNINGYATTREAA